jgi:hypothetical protein
MDQDASISPANPLSLGIKPEERQISCSTISVASWDVPFAVLDL